MKGIVIAAVLVGMFPVYGQSARTHVSPGGGGGGRAIHHSPTRPHVPRAVAPGIGGAPSAAPGRTFSTQPSTFSRSYVSQAPYIGVNGNAGPEDREAGSTSFPPGSRLAVNRGPGFGQPWMAWQGPGQWNGRDHNDGKKSDPRRPEHYRYGYGPYSYLSPYSGGYYGYNYGWGGGTLVLVEGDPGMDLSNYFPPQMPSAPQVIIVKAEEPAAPPAPISIDLPPGARIRPAATTTASETSPAPEKTPTTESTDIEAK